MELQQIKDLITDNHMSEIREAADDAIDIGYELLSGTVSIDVASMDWPIVEFVAHQDTEAIDPWGGNCYIDVEVWGDYNVETDEVSNITAKVNSIQ